MGFAASLKNWWRSREVNGVMEKIDIRTIRDNRGSLSVMEDIPFAVQRVYYLHGIEANAMRGGHAQRTTDRLLIPIHGSFSVTSCAPGGTDWRSMMLSQPTEALRVYPGEWIELTGFSSGAVCLVLASTKFEESDSVRDFKEFVRIRKAA